MRRLADEDTSKSGGMPSYTSAVSAASMMGMFIIGCYILIKCVSVSIRKRMEYRLQQAMRKRRNANDQFRYNNGYSWDVVLSFRIHDDNKEISSAQRTWNVKRICTSLASGGLQIRMFYNTMHNKMYCKVRASQLRLMKEAARIDMHLQLDEKKLKKYCQAGRPDLGWGPIGVAEISDVTTIPPYRFISAPYTMNKDGTGTDPTLKDLYQKWTTKQLAKINKGVSPLHVQEEEELENSKHHRRGGGSNMHYDTSADGDVCEQLDVPADCDSQGYGKLVHTSIFRNVDRLKLIWSIINNNTSGGCHLNIDQLIKTKCIDDYAALHDYIALHELQTNWITLLEFPWNQNTGAVKNYFGERIGLYFDWLGLYTSWLIIASIAGMIAFVNVQVEGGNPNVPVMPYFAGFMAIWGTLFTESWKRREVRLATEWGMNQFHNVEMDRPDFSGVLSRSPVTGKETLFFPDHLRTKSLIRSYGIICASVMSIIICLTLVFILRKGMDLDPSIGYYSAELTSLLIALQIEFLNYLFYRVAINLNNNENHRTDTSYENALIGKTFVFQFINSFSGLFYVSFLKPFIKADKCIARYCFYELQATLGTIFMSRLFLHNYFKLISPMWKVRKDLNEIKHIDAKTEGEAAKHEISEVEMMFLQPDFDPLMGTFNDYATMVSQFGYMTMFVSAFPLCTMLALVNNYVQLRVDAWRLCQGTQRPDPKSAQNIGKWQNVLELTGVVSVFTNSGLISFTGQFVEGYEWPVRVWIFFLMSSFILAIKYLVAAIIPDTPYEIIIQQERNVYYLEKVIENRKDIPDAIDSSALRVRPNFRLKLGDDDPL